MKTLQALVALALVAATVQLGCGQTTPAPVSPRSSASADPAPPPSPNHVEGAAARELVKNGARLLDVRSPEEYATKHIEGAQNAPVDTIDAAELGSKDAPVILYCGSGKRAARAATTLRAKGYTRVYELGEMSNWDR